MLGLGNTSSSSSSSVEVTLAERSAMSAEDAMAVRRAAGVPDRGFTSGGVGVGAASSAVHALCNGTARTDVVGAYGASSVSSCVCAHVVFRSRERVPGPASAASGSGVSRADESPWYLAATLSGMLGQSAGVSTALTGLVSVTSSVALPVYRCGPAGSLESGLDGATRELLRGALSGSVGAGSASGGWGGSPESLTACGPEGWGGAVGLLVWPWCAACVSWCLVSVWYSRRHGSVYGHVVGAGGDGAGSSALWSDGEELSGLEVPLSAGEAGRVFRAGRFSGTAAVGGASSSMVASAGGVALRLDDGGRAAPDPSSEGGDGAGVAAGPGDRTEVVRAGLRRLPGVDDDDDDDDTNASSVSTGAEQPRAESSVRSTYTEASGAADKHPSGCIAVLCRPWHEEARTVLGVVTSWAVVATQLSVVAALGLSPDRPAVGGLLAIAVLPVAVRGCLIWSCAAGCWRWRVDVSEPDAGTSGAGVSTVASSRGRDRDPSIGTRAVVGSGGGGGGGGGADGGRGGADRRGSGAGSGRCGVGWCAEVTADRGLLLLAAVAGDTTLGSASASAGLRAARLRRTDGGVLALGRVVSLADLSGARGVTESGLCSRRTPGLLGPSIRSQLAAPRSRRGGRSADGGTVGGGSAVPCVEGWVRVVCGGLWVVGCMWSMWSLSRSACLSLSEESAVKLWGGGAGDELACSVTGAGLMWVGLPCLVGCALGVLSILGALLRCGACNA